MPGACRVLWLNFFANQLVFRSQLAEQYGADVATEVVARSRSNLHLDSPSMPYTSGTQTSLSPLAIRQDTRLA